MHTLVDFILDNIYRLEKFTKEGQKYTSLKMNGMKLYIFLKKLKTNTNFNNTKDLCAKKRQIKFALNERKHNEFKLQRSLNTVKRYITYKYLFSYHFS